ncbi:hypothetical protein MBLNU457_4427t1 [Dothideomycetes sp. NU457]
MPTLFRRFSKFTKGSESQQRSPRLVADKTRLEQPRFVADSSLEPNSVALRHLLDEVKDYQITHGSLLKAVYQETENSVPSIPVGVAIFPTPFPRECFEEACAIQLAYNRLYVAIAEDEEWLASVLRDLIKQDRLVSALWSIHQQVKRNYSTQRLSLGVFRSDYMLHSAPSALENKDGNPSIKQVEMNTFSAAGGVQGNIVANMHRYLYDAGAYSTISEAPVSGIGLQLQPTLPINRTTQYLVFALKRAHEEYVRIFSPVSKCCILMIVQPRNGNICDERPIQYGLSDAGITMFRVTHGSHVLARTRLGDDKDRPLIYSHTAGIEYEVSVVYHRAGYEPIEYDDIGIDCRLRLEQSRAVKCPSVLSHLSTLKKIQQALTLPGAVERFVSAEDAAAIRRTFMPIYALDDNPQGRIGKAIATSPAKAHDHVLKPCLEGGGHNIFREGIAQYLADTPRHIWKSHVLMEMIRPPPVHNMLMTPNGIYKGRVVSELGVFGCCLWKSRGGDQDRVTPGADGVEFVFDEQAGWSFKTKAQNVDEMSVVKGYGCFDSPMLVDKLSCERL